MLAAGKATRPVVLVFLIALINAGHVEGFNGAFSLEGSDDSLCKPQQANTHLCDPVSLALIILVHSAFGLPIQLSQRRRCWRAVCVSRICRHLLDLFAGALGSDFRPHRDESYVEDTGEQVNLLSIAKEHRAML
jgi:hypothetical protein